MNHEMTTAELAGLFGISPRTVRDLAARGVLSRVAPGRFDIRAAVLAYTGHLREQAAGRGTGNAEIAVERLREARERADKIALANAKSRREMVPVDKVRAAWIGITSDVRSAVLAVPSRLPELSRAQADQVDAELRRALEALADA